MPVTPAKPAKIELGKDEFELLFDLNTYAAYEEVSGSFFLDFLVSMQEGFEESKRRKEPMYAIKRIPLKHFRVFLWAAMHGYDSNDEPVWPLTLNQVGKRLNITKMLQLIPVILAASADNLPDNEASKVAGARPTSAAASDRVNGGITSGPADAEILDSLTKTSDV